MNPSEPTRYRMLGVCLDPSAAFVAGVEDAGASRLLFPTAGDLPIPPAALVPYYPGEVVRADLRWPSHVRGSGVAWPPEARVSKERAGRFPIAYAWSMIADKSEWRWVEGKESVPPARAIAAVLAEIVEWFGDPDGDTEVALVIPDRTDEDSQQSIIEEAGHRGVRRLRLLWRPVAAGIQWCRSFGTSLGRIQARGESSGTILSLHLGLDQWEATLLDLVATGDQDFPVVPGRHRPPPADQTLLAPVTGLGLEMLREICVPSNGPGSRDMESRLAWTRLWTTPIAHRFSTGQIGESDKDWLLQTFGFRSDSDLKFRRLRWRKAVEDVIANRDQHSFPWEPKSEWSIHKQRNLTAGLKHSLTENTLGVVITGPMGNLPASEHGVTLAEERMRMLNVRGERRMAEYSSSNPAGLLAISAAQFLFDLSQNRPAYFDTLPRLKIGARERGEPAWIDLLQDAPSFVPGGVPWNRPEPFKGLRIEERKDRLHLFLSHEDEKHIRLAEVKFRAKASRRTDVEVHVQMQSAGGHARIEMRSVVVTPQKPEVTRLNWRAMMREFSENVLKGEESTSGKSRAWTAEEWLVKQPRWFPVPMRRGRSRSGWEAVQKAIVRCRQLTVVELRKVKDNLRQKYDPQYVREVNEYHPAGEHRQTAVSSEGLVSENQDVLDTFVDMLCRKLEMPRVSSDLRTEIVRTIAYTSTRSPQLHRYLSDSVRSGNGLDEATLTAIGWCLRDPSDICRFAEQVLLRLNEGLEAINVWIKALSEVLRYRDESTSQIGVRLGQGLIECLFEVVQSEFRRNNLKYRFRYALLGIEYLLRIRRQDERFMDPQCELSQQIKSASQTMIRKLRAGQVEAIGGAIDIPKALSELVDYIDRKGPLVPSLDPDAD